MKAFFFLLFIFISIPVYSQVCLVRTEKSDKDDASSGTGFFIENNKVMTCYHVVDRTINNGNRIRIEYRGRFYVSKVVAYNKSWDLAILETEVENEKVFDLAEEKPQEGDIIKCVGFPFAKWQVHSSSGKLLGEAKWRNNLGEERNKYEIKAMVHPGMSGGPLLNEEGKVCGVIIEKTVDGYPVRTFGSCLQQIKSVINKLKKGKK